MTPVLITGGRGIVGSVTRRALEDLGWSVCAFDIAAPVGHPEHGDIRDAEALNQAMGGCRGIIHMAAVSRVGWGEEDPDRCWSVNVDGTRAVIEAAHRMRPRPWLLFVSSREVYGNPAQLPVTEECPIAPVNCYGRSKAEGEKLVTAAREHGLRTAILRLPSVYGSPLDFPDRVVPSLARRAIGGLDLHLTGAEQICDFLFDRDAVRGIAAVAARLDQGDARLPVVHLATGRPTSLRDLAVLVKNITNSASEIIEEPARSFDVLGFVGCPDRARDLLGWLPSTSLEDGLTALIEALRARLGAEQGPEP